VKPRTLLLIALAAVLLFCGLPVMAVLTTTTPAAACAPSAGGSGAAVTLRTHVGPVGEFKSGQVDNAAIIVAVGADQRVPARGWVIAVATAMTESRLINTPTVTDHDSVGLFQQRPSQGWGTPEQLIDPVYTSTKFYAALLKVDNWEKLPLTVAAQKVQRSAFPDRYAKFETVAEEVVAKVAGVASITDLPGASHAVCDQEPVIAPGGWTQPRWAQGSAQVIGRTIRAST
jgi:hypothetical protein